MPDKNQTASIDLRSKKWFNAVVIAWLTFAPLVFSSMLTIYVIAYEDWIGTFEWHEWTFVFGLVVVTMSLACTPTTFLAVVTGYFLGMTGTVWVVISYMSASLIGYFMGQKLAKGFLGDYIKENVKARRIIARASNKRLLVTVLSRLSPALPFALMNVVLSVAKIPIGTFLLGGLVGMLPRTLLFVWLGSQAEMLKSALERNEGVWPVILLTALVFIIFYWIMKNPSLKKY